MLLSNRWWATMGPVHIPPCSNSWPLVFWDLHCLPQALTDKLIGVLGSTEPLMPPSQDTALSGRRFSHEMLQQQRKGGVGLLSNWKKFACR